MKILLVVGLAIFVLTLSSCTSNTPAENVVQTTESNSLCALGCQNYVDKCLNLVPGASQQLFEEGRVSCLKECALWSTEKRQCMETVDNCVDMTAKCEL